jgi:outer membrane lipoprotein SlyB
MLRTIRLALTGAILAASCAAVMAQPVRGTIEKVDGNVLALRSSDGAELKLTLTENATIVAVVKASMADIKEGTFLGSAAMPQPDGSQKALEVHIFPEQMRGTGEGHRPYAPVPSGTMTNGAATEPTVTGVDGHTIVVRYKDGEKKIVIPPGIPILRYEIGSKGDLKAGARVTVFAPTKKPDGTLEASRINVGRDGVVPQ